MQFSNRIRTHRKKLAAVAVVATVVAGAVGVAEAQRWEDPDFTVKLEPGDNVELVRSSGDGGGGTSAPVYSTATGRHLGAFTTDVTDGQTVFDLLFAARDNGTSRAETVELSLPLGRGTLRERHTANLAVLAEPAEQAGYDAVVAVIGEGELQPGTGVFEDAAGTSSLVLVFEVDFDGPLPPVVRTGTLRFDIE